MTDYAYVLGHPVAHSKSPAMHNAAYRVLGIDWEYGLADCETLIEARDFLKQDEWRACNVTMPYKPLALDMADCADEAALAADGANVLVRDAEAKIHAFSTDGTGCISYLRRCGVNFDGAQVCVCGTGPTAASIAFACGGAGVRVLTLLSRDERKAFAELERLALSLEDETRPCLLAGVYENSSSIISESDIVIDATSLGMQEGDPAPFDTSLLSASQIVFDVVYGHGETALMGAARAAGCRAFDGSGMLVAQAVETVYDIAEVTGAFEVPADVDLFAIMADAAGFHLD